MAWPEKIRRASAAVFGSKIEGTRVFPITTKIVLIFTIFLLASNLTTNWINLAFNREEQVKNMKELLVKDLKELYSFANNQHEIMQFNRDEKATLAGIQEKALGDFKFTKSVALAVRTNGAFLVRASRAAERAISLADAAALRHLLAERAAGRPEGTLALTYAGERYFAVWKWNERWQAFIVRGEELTEFHARSREIFWTVALVSILITIACALVGIMLLRSILRYMRLITDAIMKMSQEQTMGLIPLKGAGNDDITFLGVAFNSLSSSINNLVQIFRKFANRDVAQKAYEERVVRLEGTKRELVCLFTDIRGFTYMTETLGTDIITLLNMHYDRAIREILNRDGVIGSIIGDALLAVFGAIEGTRDNKSVQALAAAYKIQEVAAAVRVEMTNRKRDIERRKGRLSPEEDRVYKAVLIEVGVGIDGGEVFYGNIGSVDRMTNTVIGDNVNSASRLEGLTRVYHVPVICSEFVKTELEAAGATVRFLELDTVQVKGKTVGKKIYWPILPGAVPRGALAGVDEYAAGLDAYYEGNWRKAETHFRRSRFQPASVFLDRIKGKNAPKGWSGIWAMTAK